MVVLARYANLPMNLRRYSSLAFFGSTVAACLWLGRAIGGAETPIVAQMIVDDCFSEPPPAPPETVDGFTAYGGAWLAEDGILTGRGDGGAKLLCDGPPLADAEISAEIYLTENMQWCGLIAWVSEPAIGADRFHGYEISVNPARRELRLGLHRNNFELIRDVPCELPVGEWVELSVSRQGARVEVRVNGKTMVSHDEGAQPMPPGRAGFRVWQGGLSCRNFRIVAAQTARPIPLRSVGADGNDPRYNTSGAWTPLANSGRAEFRYRDGGQFGVNKSQAVALRGGTGKAGIAFAGRQGEGLAFVAGELYEGAVWARADQPMDLQVSAETGDGGVLATSTLAVAPGDWQRLPLVLIPAADEPSGRLVVAITTPGEVHLERVSLAPADWAWPESLSFKRLPPILFLARPMLGTPPAVGCDIWAASPTAPGAAICVIEPQRPTAAPKVVFKDPAGSIYDINLSMDAQTVFFSYRREGEKHWHLWRIGVDGEDLRQITDGPFYDISPCELPDGDLVFVSTRRFGHTVCQPGPASNLYRVSRDGGRPKCLSMNTLSDTTPQILPDGRVLFMRWEYVDRDLTYRQSLWTQNPDGTAYQLYFGNTLRDPATLWQARPVPAAEGRVLATFAPHHGYPHGAIGWIERQHGPETPRGVGYNWITQEFPTIGDQSHVWSYRDPFPLDAETFLCSYAGSLQRFRIWLHDTRDRKRVVFEHPEWHCFFPIALRPVPRPPRIAPRAPAADRQLPDLPEEHPAVNPPMGTCMLIDVYRGLEPTIERGQVKSLRIMEQVRKTEDIPVTPHVVDFGPRAYDQSPLMSYGTYYAKRCWGSVPVEEDGSAHFRLPALREVYLQACDAAGRELQRMTSALQVMPGEVIGCVGCHENRGSTPPFGREMPLAARRRPSIPQKPDWAPDGIIDFVTVVQPVLDKHCTRCHHGADPDGGCDLSGDKTRLFNMAYDNLLGRSRSYRQHKMDTGEMLPEEAAKGKPLVHFYWLLKTPTAVSQPLWAGSHASRLTELIESEHAGAALSREDRERLYTWIDADVPYYGTYATSRAKCGGKRDLCQNPETGEPEGWFARGFMPVYVRRCASCHGEFPGTRLVTCWDGQTAWINFSHPEWSAALTAHLPGNSGGRNIDRTADGKAIPMFAGTADPDYRAMLAAIDEGSRRAQQTPGPDMPGYQGRRREP